MALHLHRDHEHRRRRWRNGAGLTAELASSPPHADAASDFAWRVSLAEIHESGGFSRFPGVDRIITLVDGPPITLRLPQTVRVLRQFDTFAFDGGADVLYDVVAPGRDLNVMTRRGRATATVEVLHLSSAAAISLSPGEPLLVVGLDGDPRVVAEGVTVRVGVGDVVASDAPLLIDGGGRVAVVRITESAAVGEHCGRCHCGDPLVRCAGCDSPRCLACDPYRSDDCRWFV